MNYRWLRHAVFHFIVLLPLLSLYAQSAPSIASLSPSVGPVSPVGGSVTIKGTGFGATRGSSVVTFGGTASTPTFWSDTKIVSPVPGTLAAGFVDVAVNVNGASSNAKSFLVIPVITRTSPSSGVVGAAITVTGTSFGNQQGASTITLTALRPHPPPGAIAASTCRSRWARATARL